MTLRMKVDASRALAKARRIQAVTTSVTAALPKIEEKTLAYANKALNNGVYNTKPGKYRRTFQMRQQLFALVVRQGQRIQIQVRDSAPGSLVVETGYDRTFQPQIPFSLVTGQTPEWSVANGKVPKYGRSALNWKNRQPFVQPAGLYAAWLIAAEYRKRIRAFK